MTTVGLIALAALFTVAGGLKLLGLAKSRADFERFGLGDGARLGIGALEIGLVAVALVGLSSPTAALVAAVGALIVMVGAFATHVRVRDGATEYVPAVLVTAAAIVVLVGL